MFSPRIRLSVVPLVALALLLAPVGASAETILHEGLILDEDNIPIEGVVSIRLAIYDSVDGDQELWSETHDAVVVAGYYTLQLGKAAQLKGVFDGGERWLGIALDGADELAPRQPLAAVPRSFVAVNAVGDLTPASIDVEGTADVGGDLRVEGEAAVGGELQVGGYANVGGGLQVDGDVDLGGEVLVDGGLEVSGGILVAGRTVVDAEGSVAGLFDGLLDHDGPESGLDADRLDGIDSSEFVTSGDQILALILDFDGQGTGLDADRLDGIDSSEFATTGDVIRDRLLEFDGPNSGLDADRLDGKDSSEYVTTGDHALALLLDADGQGSGLDADLLDGMDSDEFATTGDVIRDRLLGFDGANSGLDADRLDGKDSSEFATTGAVIKDRLLGVDGAGSGIDADLLDGKSSAEFATTGKIIRDRLLGADGAGSGLDADRLDGIDSSALVTKGAGFKQQLVAADGAGSGVDADLFDGTDSASFVLKGASFKQQLFAADGTGSGLDADRIDGKDSSEFATTGAVIRDRLAGVDGSGSGLDADRLDGNDSSVFMRANQNTKTTGDLRVDGSLSVGQGLTVGGAIVSGGGLSIDGDLTVGGSLDLEGGIPMVRRDDHPPNPTAGTLYFNTDEKAFYGYNGSDWVRLDGVAEKEALVYSGYCSSHGTGGGWNRYCTNQEEFNTIGGALAPSSNGTFRVNTSGLYRINAFAISHGGSYPHIRLIVNGSYQHYGHEYGNGSWTDNFLDVTYQLNAGDTFYIDYYRRGSYAYHAGSSYSRVQVTQLQDAAVWSGYCSSHGSGGGWRTYCTNRTEYNTASAHLSVSSGGTFTARTTGFYRINYFGIHLGGGWAHINLMVNGSYKHHGHDRGKGGWGDNFMDLTWPMNAGDTFYVRIHNPGSYAYHSGNGRGAHSRLQVSFEGGPAGSGTEPYMWSGGCRSHGTGGGWKTYCTNGEDFNTASAHLSVSSGGTFTVRKPGYYRINAWAISHGGGWQHTGFVVNGSAKYQGHERGNGSWSDNFMDLIWPMNSGDTFYVRYHNPGSYAFHSWNSNGAHSRLQVSFVGNL